MNINYREYPLDQLDFIEVAEKHELPNGERMFLEIGEISIVIFNIAGKFFAIGDICSHDDGPVGDGELLEDNQYEIICPRHGAHFDIRNGYAITPPAVVNIPAYPIRENNGKLEVGLPKIE